MAHVYTATRVLTWDSSNVICPSSSLPSPLACYLPFWTAFDVERFIFFLLPLVVLFGLLILYFPMLWRFYMQGKVLPVYKQLRQVEIELLMMDAAATDAAIQHLSVLEAHVTQRVRVSAAYMPEIFHLRSHIRSVIVDLARRREKLKEAGPGIIDNNETNSERDD